MRKKTRFYYIVILSQLLTVLFVVFGLGGCGGCNDTTLTNTGTSSAVTTIGTADATGNLLSTTGYVSTSSTGTRSIVTRDGRRISVRDSDDACNTGTFEAFLIGGGETAFSTGTVAGGNYTLEDLPLYSDGMGQEALIEFTCSDSTVQRCLVKAGSEGTLCNATADAVIGAFEAALDMNIKTETTLVGKPISQIGSAIVDASKQSESSTAAFKSAIATCKAMTDATEKKTCYKNAIEASAFKGVFDLMQMLASDWDVPSVYTLIADTLGYTIMIDSFLYTTFGTHMDTWFNTDFIEGSRAFIKNVIDDQIAGGNNYVVKVECFLWYSKYHSGGTMTYDPVMVTNSDGIEEPSCKNDADLALNGIDGTALTALYAAMDSDSYEQVVVSEPSAGACATDGWNVEGCFSVSPPSLKLSSKYKEANRNDPTGKQRNEDNMMRMISIINVFQEFEESMQERATRGESGCVQGGENGPPNIDTCSEAELAIFGAEIAAQKKYFAGLMGLYMYLTSDKKSSEYGISAANQELSLADIHEIFTGSDYLNAKLSAWGPAFFGNSTINVEGVNHSIWLPTLLDYNESLDIYHPYSVFMSSTQEQDDLVAALNDATIPYSATFQRFETTPNAATFQDEILGASKHEEWNPMGQKYFNIPGVEISGTVYPIYAKYTDITTGQPMQVALSDKSKIELLADPVDAGVAADSDTTGAFTLPDNFAYYNVLMERGWMGDDKGRLFILADRITGQEVRAGDKPIYLWEYNTGNSACKTEAEKNTVVEASLKFGFGEDTQEEVIKAYCIDMSDFSISDYFRFYNGGEIEINESDGNGNSWTYNIQQIGRIYTDETPPTVEPVCLYVPSGYFSEENGVTTSTAATITSGQITVLGTAKIDTCSTSTDYSDYTKYYLTMNGSYSESQTRDSMRAYLRADADGAQPAYQRFDPDTMDEWTDSLIYLIPSVIEAALDETDTSADNTGDTQVRVSSTSAPSFIKWTKLLNSAHDVKFDPYCDDTNGDGKCNCWANGTAAADQIATNHKETACTIEDIAAEPTLSERPYFAGGNEAALYESLFSQCGGESGSTLATCFENDGATVALTGEALQNLSIFMPWEDVFYCAYLVTGETTYRKPRFVRWEGFHLNAEGCPDSNGDIADITDWGGNNEAGGGPVRMVNPKPMQNAYRINRPKTYTKLYNWATKTVGQGKTIESTAKLFAFDEALALLALMYQRPPDIDVYRHDSTEKTDANIMRDASIFYEAVELGNHTDDVSALLYFLINQ